MRCCHTARIFFAAPLLLALACGGDAPDSGEALEPAPAPAPAATPAGDAEAPAAPAGGGVALVIADGPAAGTYEHAGETVCARGGDSWIVGFSEAGVLETQAVLNGLTDTGGTTTDLQFSAVVGEGTADGTMFVITSTSSGTAATATLRIDDSRGELDIEGTTPDGLKVSAKFRCSHVAR